MPTYLVVNTKGSQKTAVVAGRSTTISTPITPSKAPTKGLVWPKGR